MFENVKTLSPFFEELLHSKIVGLPFVVDVRNCGFMAAVELEPIEGWPTTRSLDVFDRCFQKGVMVCHLSIIFPMCPIFHIALSQNSSMIQTIIIRIYIIARSFLLIFSSNLNYY